MEDIDLSSVKYSTFLDDFLEIGIEADGYLPPLEFTQVRYPVKLSPA